jgi:hypothetical protein
MSHSSRPLIRPCALAYAQAFAEARADLAAMNYEHQRELANLRAELDRLHAEIADLRSIMSDVVVGLRQEADRDVAALRAKLQSVLIRLSRNDERLPLH